MKVTVEFLGVAGLAAGTREVTLELPEGTTFRQIVRRLSERYPDLVGKVIAEDRETMFGSNILNRNGKTVIRDELLDTCPQDGDKLFIMAILAGG